MDSIVLSQSHTSNNKSRILTIVKLDQLNISLFYYFLKKIYIIQHLFKCFKSVSPSIHQIKNLK
jgi:hypothetical protein